MGKATRKLVLVLVVMALWLVAGCGGKDKAGGAKSPDAGNMDDALALLPGSAIALGTVDARAFFGSQTFGSDLAKLVERYLPIGQEAGFSAARDVDRVTFASYSYQGVDVAAVVVGTFDEAKIRAVAAQRTPTKGGGALVASQYAGREVFTVSNVGFTLLSSKRAIVGTEAGIRRVLERIKDNRVKRDIAPWMIQAIETPGAAAAVAVDLVTQPMSAEVARQVPVGFVQTLRAARIVATFKDNATQLAASLTYPDEAQAQTQAQAVKQAAGMSRWLALVGIRVQNVEVKSEKSDVQVTLGIDDQSLRQMLATVPQWIGQ